MIWALRLGAYLVWRIQRIKKDTRFESIRGKPLQFSFFLDLSGIDGMVLYATNFGHPC